MKSLKSLFALIALVALSFACNSVTDADHENFEPLTKEVEATGNQSEPIITKPKM